MGKKKNKNNNNNNQQQQQQKPNENENKAENKAENKKENVGDGEKKKDVNPPVVLKIDMHCEGCATKIRRCVRGFEGVEKVDTEGNKVTVVGKVDPIILRDKLAEKFKRKVELVSPLPPKKDKADNKSDEKAEKKPDDKKPKEPPVTTAVLKMSLHCQGCIGKINRTTLKTKGVQEMSLDKQKELLTVKGTMDAKALAEALKEKLKRNVEIVPPKKEKEGGKEGEKKDDNGGGGGGGGKKKGGGDGGQQEEGGGKMEAINRMEMLPGFGGFGGYGYGHGHGHGHPQPGFGYGYGNGNAYGYPSYGNGYGYGHGHVNGGFVEHMQPPPQMYPPQMMQPPHPPQMFSDENPNACSIM